MSALSPPSTKPAPSALTGVGRGLCLLLCDKRERKGRQHFLLSPLDGLPAKAGGAAGGGAYAPFILTARWLGWLCYIPR